MAKFATNANGVMLLLNLIQVTDSISGSVVPLAMFFFRIIDTGCFRKVVFWLIHVGEYRLKPTSFVKPGHVNHGGTSQYF